METIKVDLLRERTLYNSDLLINKDFIAVPAGITVSKELIEMLRTWGIPDLFCTGTISKEAGGGNIPENQSIEKENKKAEKQSQIVDDVYQVLEEATRELTSENEDDQVAAVMNVFLEYTNYINFLYTRYATHNEIDSETLSDVVLKLCFFIKKNKRSILLAESKRQDTQKIKYNFLVYHSLRSTIIAIIIGTYLHMGDKELMELGEACILHEIGMIRIPPQLYMTDKHLSQKEFAQLSTHTVIGYNIAKDLDLPLGIQLGILEHHEKENGTGYPRHMTGESISNFAKIISVACSFEAITASRKHKQERSYFDAMVEMLKNNNKQYDEKIIKALLNSISLYPIGTYVYLANGKIGLVTDVLPDRPRNPVVQLLTEKDEDGNKITIQTDDGAMKISRVLTKQEKDDVTKILSS